MTQVLDLVPIWTVILGMAVFFYVLLDGFDLGVGMLFGLAPDTASRNTIMNTIAPVWDGNETWLVFGGLGLLAAFPLAFAIIIPALYFPIMVMLLALVFRGVAFEFRFRDSENKTFWDHAFCYGSGIATFAQGLVLGTFIQGFRVSGRQFAGSSFDFLSPFALLTAVALLFGYSLLGAGWLILKTEGAVQAEARRQGCICLIGVLLAIGLVSIWTPLMSETIAARWFSWPNILLLAPVPLATAAVAWVTWRALANEAQATPFFGAMGLFVLSYLGIAISLYPMIVPHHFTLWQAASSDRTQAFLLVGTLALLPVILMYTGWSYWVFRGKVRSDFGYHSDSLSSKPKPKGDPMNTMFATPAERVAVADASPTKQMRTKKRIVIIGGGFAGIAAARALKHADADVVLIDRRNHHIFQPLLYQAATAVLSPSEIAAPLRQLAVKQSNLDVVLAEVTGVDLNARTIDASYPGLGTRTIAFDFLVLATGMRPSYFGHDEFAQHAPALKNLNDAETIRTKLLSAFELADATDDAGERGRQMTFILVGAGPTGVELAGSIAHMVAVTLRGNFRHINPAESTIILLEGGNRVLPSFAESLSRKATQRLEKLGVKAMTGVMVEKVNEQGVIAGGKRIPSATVLWTAGVAASPIVKMLGATTDRAGRVTVGPYLDAPNAPGVFVIGDTASVVQDGRPVPGVAQAAIQQGRFVGRLISERLEGREPKHPFRYLDKGNMAVVGKNFAILEAGRVRMSGFFTWLIWAFIHVASLPQLQNRLRVETQWLWSYLTGQRSSRLISEVPRTVADSSASRRRSDPSPNA
jgi:NADH:ubiquinone reductase (H+-translocating)